MRWLLITIGLIYWSWGLLVSADDGSWQGEHWQAGQPADSVLDLRKIQLPAPLITVSAAEQQALTQIRRLLAQGAQPAAQQALLAWLQRYPDSPQRDSAADMLAQLTGQRLRLYPLGSCRYASGRKPVVLLTAAGLAKVAFTIWRVPLLSVLRAGMDPAPAFSLAPRYGQKVASWQAHYDRQAQQYKITLPITSPGFYAVRAQGGMAVDQTWLLISDLALLVKRDKERVLVWVSSPGQEMGPAGVELLAFAGSRLVYQGRTRPSGLAVVQIKGQRTMPLTWVARQGAHAVLCASSWYRLQHKLRRCYVYTPQAVYAPGATVPVLIMLQTFQQTGQKYCPGADVQVRIILRNPHWQQLACKTVQTNAWGVATTQFVLPAAAPTGRYSLRVQGRFCGDAFFMVPAKPSLELHPASPQIRPDQPVRITLSRADDHSLTGRLVYQIYTRPAQTHWLLRPPRARLVLQGDTPITANRSWFQFTPPAHEEVLHYDVYAQLTTADGHKHQGYTELQILPTRWHLRLRTSALIYKPGEGIEVYLQARDNQQRPLSRPVTISWFQGQRLIGRLEGRTNALGQFRHRWKAWPPGLYKVQAQSVAHGATIRASTQLLVTGSRDYATDDLLRLQTNAQCYSAGQTMQALISTCCFDRPLLVTWQGEKLLAAQLLRPAGALVGCTQAITAAYAPWSTCQVALFHGPWLLQQQQVIVIPPTKRFLKVQLQEQTRTAQELALQLRITAPGDQPARAALCLAVRDLRAGAFPDVPPTDIRRFFYGLHFDTVTTFHSGQFVFLKQREDPFIPLRHPQTPAAPMQARPVIHWKVGAASAASASLRYWRAGLQTDSDGNLRLRVPLSCAGGILEVLVWDAQGRVGRLQRKLSSSP